MPASPCSPPLAPGVEDRPLIGLPAPGELPDQDLARQIMLMTQQLVERGTACDRQRARITSLKASHEDTAEAEALLRNFEVHLARVSDHLRQLRIGSLTSAEMP